MPVTKAKVQEIIYRFSRQPGCAVEQRDVHRTFGGHISRGNRLEVTHAPLHVMKRKPRRIHSLAKRFNGIDRLVVSHHRRCLTPAHRAVRARNFHHHDLKNVCA